MIGDAALNLWRTANYPLLPHLREQLVHGSPEGLAGRPLHGRPRLAALGCGPRPHDGDPNGTVTDDSAEEDPSGAAGGVKAVHPLEEALP